MANSAIRLAGDGDDADDGRAFVARRRCPEAEQTRRRRNGQLVNEGLRERGRGISLKCRRWKSASPKKGH